MIEKDIGVLAVLMKALLQKKSIVFLGVLSCVLTMSIACTAALIIPDVNVRVKSAVRATAVPTQIISKQSIKNSPEYNFEQLLKQSSSNIRIVQNSGDATQTSLSMRGFGDNATANSLILVDGFPLTNPSLLAPNLNALLLADIQRIDIHTGSAGTLWGDQAVGGVMNIITERPQKFSLLGWFSAANYARDQAVLLYKNHFDSGASLKFFAATGDAKNYRQHNQQQNYNLGSQLAYDYAQGNVFLQAQSYRDRIEFPGGLTYQQYKHQPRVANEHKNFSQFITRNIRFFFQHSLYDHVLLEMRASHQHTHGHGFVNMSFNRHDQLFAFNPRIIGHWSQHKIIFGTYHQVGEYAFTNSKKHANAQGQQQHVYLQTQTLIADAVKIILGARFAMAENNLQLQMQPSYLSRQQVLVTEQGLQYQYSKDLSFYIRRDGNFRFPKSNEALWIPQNIQRLHQQTGSSYETGATWQWQKLTSTINLYKLFLNHEIAFNPQQTTEQPFGAFNNLAKTVRTGIGINQQYEITPQWHTQMQLNYVNPRMQSGAYVGKIIPAVPKILGQIGLHYKINEHWSLQNHVRYTGSRFASQDLQNISRKVSAYWVDDMSVQYQLRSLTFNFAIHNVFASHYANYVVYDVRKLQNMYYPATGRDISFNVKVEL